MKYSLYLVLLVFNAFGIWMIWRARPIINIGEPPEYGGVHAYKGEYYTKGQRGLTLDCYYQFNCIYQGPDKISCVISEDGSKTHCAWWPAEQNH